MSDARAYARFQFRRFVGSWEWFWFVLASFYVFVIGQQIYSEAWYYVLFMVFMTAHMKESPGRGDTGFGSMQAYLISRPLGRRQVYRLRKANDFVWGLTLLAALAFGLLTRATDSADLVYSTEPVVDETPYVWLAVLGIISAYTVCDTLMPHGKVSRPQRTVLDAAFTALVWLAYFGSMIAAVLYTWEAGSAPRPGVSTVFWAAGVTGFFVLYAPRIARRYDFVAIGSNFSWWWSGDLSRRLGRASRTRPARPGRGLRGLMSSLFVYPALIWLAFFALWWIPVIQRDRPVWEPMGLFSLFMLWIPMWMIAVFTNQHFYSRGQTPSYVLSRPITRAQLAVTNSRAFGLSGLIVIAIVIAVGWSIDGQLGPAALFLPWGWLFFLYTGSLAMAWSFSSPALNSPLGLVGSIILVCVTAMAIIIEKPPQTWPTPLAPILCNLAAFALGVVVVVVTDRHVRNADIG